MIIFHVVIVGDTKQLPNVVTDDIKAKAKAIYSFPGIIVYISDSMYSAVYDAGNKNELERTLEDSF